MTIQEFEQLHNGDQVMWEDPDDGICSRALTVHKAEVLESDSGAVRIVDITGDVVEAFLWEIS